MALLSSSERAVVERVGAEPMLDQVLSWAAVNSGSRNLAGLERMAEATFDAILTDLVMHEVSSLQIEHAIAQLREWGVAAIAGRLLGENELPGEFGVFDVGLLVLNVRVSERTFFHDGIVFAALDAVNNPEKNPTISQPAV